MKAGIPSTSSPVIAGLLGTYRFLSRVQKLFSLMDTILHTSFTTCAFGPDDSWVHKDWNLALLGDACHPMVPYRAQGAAMAVCGFTFL